MPARPICRPSDPHEHAGRDHRGRAGHGAGHDARGELAAHARGRVRYSSDHVVRHRGLPQPASPPKSTSTRSTTERRRSNAAAGRAAIGSVLRAASEALADAGLLDSAPSIARASASSWAQARPICSATKSSTAPGSRRAFAARAARIVWNHFPSTPVDVIAGEFGFEGPRACVVAACSSSTIAIGRGVEAIRSGRADAVLAGGTDALARLTYSGFNLLRLMDRGAVPAVRSQPRGDEHRRGRGNTRARAISTGHARRGAQIYAELAGHGARMRGVSSDRARTRGQAGRGGRHAGARGCRYQRRRGASTSTRTERPRRRTTPPKRAASGACSATARRGYPSRRSSR